MKRSQALKLLKTHQSKLSRQQYKTIKGQILCGDVTGALKGLRKILAR